PAIYRTPRQGGQWPNEYRMVRETPAVRPGSFICYEMEAVAGVEPAHSGFADRRVNHFTTRPQI
ncbi:MAG: hypothetical protein UY72_C0042G0001, partial [Candidatus Uhrbacteria bacterium GW2011_GWD2_52_7]